MGISIGDQRAFRVPRCSPGTGIYTHSHIHTYTYTYTHIQICKYTHPHIHTYTFGSRLRQTWPPPSKTLEDRRELWAHIHTYTYTHKNTCTQTYSYTSNTYRYTQKRIPAYIPKPSQTNPSERGPPNTDTPNAVSAFTQSGS